LGLRVAVGRYACGYAHPCDQAVSGGRGQGSAGSGIFSGVALCRASVCEPFLCASCQGSGACRGGAWHQGQVQGCFRQDGDFSSSGHPGLVGGAYSRRLNGFFSYVFSVVCSFPGDFFHGFVCCIYGLFYIFSSCGYTQDPSSGGEYIAVL